MKIFFKFFITFIFINIQSVYSEVYKVDNNQLQNLIVSGVPIIDIRTKDEWLSTGVIKNSHLLTFFDEYGNYDVEGWEYKLKKIVNKEDPFILICRSGSRTSIISNYLSKSRNYSKVYDVKNGIKYWISQGNKTFIPKNIK